MSLAQATISRPHPHTNIHRHLKPFEPSYYVTTTIMPELRWFSACDQLLKEKQLTQILPVSEYLTHKHWRESSNGLVAYNISKACMIFVIF